MILPMKILLALGVLLLLPLQAEIAQPQAKQPPAAEGTPTVIDSDNLKMTTLDDQTTHFAFSKNVKVTTTDMTIFCDRLEVFAARQDDAAEGEASELGRIQKILAIGNVRILQEDREATSGRAEVSPQDGTIVLTENPVLRDQQGKVSGARITFNQGERSAQVESDETQSSRVVLPTLPALGADAKKRTRENERTID